MRIPATIFTGFLGSGKTTIISHLIDELQANQIKVAYIKNEIGDADLDAQLLRGKHIVSQELLNGCICCTLVGPFGSAVDELVATYQPDRIIIEAAGTADPAALALMVSAHPLLIRDGVISVIDVVNFEGYQDLTVTAQAQTQLTDLIIFNKVELVDEQRKQAVVGYVRELNSHSPILEAPHGRINPEVVFGLASSELDELLVKSSAHSPEHHLAHDGLTAFSLEVVSPITVSQLESWLQTLPKVVFRIKGWVYDNENTAWLINKVGHRVTADQLTQSSLPPTGILILIGYQVHLHQTEIARSFKSLVSPK